MHTTSTSTTITVRLDRQLAAWLGNKARELGISQGQLVRDELRRARQAKPSNQAFMRIAGSIAGAANLSRRKGFSSK